MKRITRVLVVSALAAATLSACTDNGAADKISCFSNTTPNQGTDRLVDLVAPAARSFPPV